MKKERASERRKGEHTQIKSKNRANQVVSDRFNVRCLRSLSLVRSLSPPFRVCTSVREQRHTHCSYVKMDAIFVRNERRMRCPCHSATCHAHNIYMFIMRLFAVLVETGRGRGKTVDGKVLFTYALSFYLRLPLTWRAVILLLPLPFLLAHFVIIASLCMCVCVFVCIGM